MKVNTQKTKGRRTEPIILSIDTANHGGGFRDLCAHLS